MQSSNGTALTSPNSSLRIGTFSVVPNDPALTGTDFAALDALFTPLGTENVDAGSGNTSASLQNPYTTPGVHGGAVTGVTTTFLSPNTALYLWIFNNNDPSAAGEWGIFHDPAWVAPNDLGSVNLATFQINQASDAITGRHNIGDGAIQLAVVPEPSTSLFALFSAGLLVLRRRRR